MTPKLIKPTVGRALWFFPGTALAVSRGIAYEPGTPLAASIVYVHGDRMVNLAVLDTKGKSHGLLSVPLLQENDAPPSNEFFAMWMPYQNGQAAKAEALEAKLADRLAPDDLTVRLFINRGTIVTINGIPLAVEHDTVMATHPGNVPLIHHEATAGCKSELAD